MMQHIRRSAVSSKRKYTAHLKPLNATALGVEHGSTDAARLNFTDRLPLPLPLLLNAGCVRRGFAFAGPISGNELRVEGNNVRNRVHSTGPSTISHYSSWQLSGNRGTNRLTSIFARSFASTASDKKTSEAKKEISKVEDPFDAPTYNIPEKPVTFVEGASYSIVIIAGLAVAGATAYAALNELVFQPKEYKVFNKTLKRIQDDGQVRVRIGSPITGYGQESRNRAARQRIPHRIWKDEDGIEHIEVNFYIRGPHGAGKVFCRMFKDKAEKEWKFTSLVVQISSPSPAQLLLESYVPV